MGVDFGDAIEIGFGGRAQENAHADPLEQFQTLGE
jgi:hypothetical protein